MAAHKHFFIKLNQIFNYTRFITFAVVQKRGNEWRGPTPRLIAPGQRSYEENVAAVASRWL